MSQNYTFRPVRPRPVPAFRRDFSGKRRGSKAGMQKFFEKRARRDTRYGKKCYLYAVEAWSDGGPRAGFAARADTCAATHD